MKASMSRRRQLKSQRNRKLRVENLEERRVLAYADVVLALEPLVYYGFNEGSGSVAVDGSSHGANGTFVGDATRVTGRTGLPGDQALQVSGAGRVSVDNATAALATIAATNQASVSLWQLNSAPDNPRNSTIFSGFDAGNNRQLQTHLLWGNNINYFDSAGGAGATQRIERTATAAEVNQFETQWNHWVFVKDGVNDVMSVYLNGQMWNSGIRTADLGSIVGFFIGQESDGSNPHIGMIDDFAIFDRVLSESEIAQLATTNTFIDWTGGAGDGNWNNAANWANANVPDAASEVAVFRDSGAGAVTIDATHLGIGGLEFRNSSAAYTIVATSGSITTPNVRQYGSSSNTINAQVNLSGAEIFSAQAGTNLTLAGAVNVGGDTLAIDGDGDVSILGTMTAGAFGRYISVKNLPDTARLLHIGEIEAFLVGVTPTSGALDNANDVALSSKGATVEQTIGPIAHGNSAALIDGAPQSGGATFTLDTAVGNEDIIDLGQNRFLGSVRLWQRTDCCYDRLSNVQVSVLSDAANQPNAIAATRRLYSQVPNNSSDSIVFDTRLVKSGSGTLTLGGNNRYGGGTYIDSGELAIANATGSATGSGEVFVGAVQPKARFIRVIANIDSLNRFFGFGELEAFAPGVTPNPTDVDARDLALTSKGATIEHDNRVVGGGHGTAASLLNGSREIAGDTWTRQDFSPEIVVDLGQSLDVGLLRLWQRNDGCCQDRLSNFTVELFTDHAGNPGSKVFSASYPGQAPTNSFAAINVPAAAATTATLSGNGRISGAITFTAGSTMQPGVTSAKITGGGFENPAVPLGQFPYGGPAGSPWTFSATNSGVATNTSPFNVNAPEGTTVAFLQRAAFIEQTVNGLIPGEAYTVTFASAARPGNNANNFFLTVDGDLIHGGRAFDSTFRDYTSGAFIATSNSATIRFESTFASADQTTYIDNVRLNALLPVTSPTLINPSFEDGPTNLPAPQYGAQLNGWAASTGGTGNNGNASGAVDPFVFNSPPPDGVRAAFIQNAGVLSQLIRGLTPGKEYQLEYYENARNGNTAQISVRVDGATLVPTHAVNRTTTNRFTRVTTQPFTATSSAMLLELVNSATPDNTALFDHIRVIEKVAPVVNNGGFEGPAVGTFAELTNPTGWTGTGTPPPTAAGPGVIRNGSGYGGPDAPEGSQRALLKGTSSLSQDISGFVVANRYSLTYSYAARQGRGEIAPLQVSVGGNVVDNVTVNSTVASFQTRTIEFVATASTLSLNFANLNNSPLGRADGDNSIFLDDVYLRLINAAPVIASAGGPYAIAEGQGLTLAGAPATDADGDAITSYGWDLNGDGDFSDASGPTPTLSWAQLVALGINDNGNYTASARATDAAGLTSVAVSAPLTVTNSPPTATNIDLGGLDPDTIAVFQPVVFTFSITDPSPADEAGMATFEIDWDNDGIIDETVVGPASGTPVTHAFDTIDPATVVSVTGIDKDGGVGPTESITLNVGSIGYDADGNLIVSGTSFSDAIILSFSGGVMVRIGRTTTGPYNTGDKVTVYGGNGSDRISTYGRVPFSLVAFGGAGNDYIAGSPNADLLDGGDGNDRILGGDGNDVLLGGAGNDRVSGGNGDDTIFGDGYVDPEFGVYEVAFGQIGETVLVSNDAGAGRDTLYGDRGNDTIYGGDGADSIYGSNGNDILFGDAGNDRLDGGNDDDIVVGGDGSDKLYGGNGSDLLLAGTAADILYGGSGDDLLVSDATIYDDDIDSLTQILQDLVDGEEDFSTWFDIDTVGPFTPDVVYGQRGADQFYSSKNDTNRDFRASEDLLTIIDADEMP